MKYTRPIDLTFGAVFVCLMAIGANITVWFPILAIPIGGATVPLSLQTFFATLAGLMLGRKLGGLTMMTYTLVGVAGVPVFAGLSAGPMALVNPTGGFIFSFIFVAYLTGCFIEKMKRINLLHLSFAAIIGLVVNYGVGVTYMYVAMNTWLNLHISYLLAWSSMIPFLIKDGVLAWLAAAFMIQLSKRVKFKSNQTNIKVSS